jgi:hypothetical protein
MQEDDSLPAERVANAHHVFSSCRAVNMRHFSTLALGRGMRGHFFQTDPNHPRRLLDSGTAKHPSTRCISFSGIAQHWSNCFFCIESLTPEPSIGLMLMQDESLFVPRGFWVLAQYCTVQNQSSCSCAAPRIVRPPFLALARSGSSLVFGTDAQIAMTGMSEY